MSKASFPEESCREPPLRNAVLVMWFEGVVLMSVPSIRVARNVGVDSEGSFTRRGHHVLAMLTLMNKLVNNNNFRASTRAEAR